MRKSIAFVATGLLATPAVGHVLRTSSEGREVVGEPLDGGELIVWTARSDVDATRYVAAFWTGEQPHRQSLPLSALVGHQAALARTWSTRDLWTGDAGPEPDATTDEPGGLLTVDLAPHGVVWLALDPR